MAETYGDYFRGLGRSIGQGVTFGFGDEIEAGIRALGAGTYDEEVAKIRADLEKFRETNPVSAYGSEIAASLPTGLGLGALALRAGVRGVGKIGAVEGALYGAGVGEDAEDRAVSAAIGAPLGAVGAKVGEKVFEGIAPLIGRAMKARGAGAETRGSGEALMKEPVTTVKAYKLFKVDKDGGLHPLFVKMGDKQPLPVGKWIDAEAGELNPSTGKVKSSIGDLAYRPGFHAGDLPIATHIGGKVDPLTGERVKGSMKPNIREDNQVWAEVEMPADVDWQRIADSRARIMKSGKPDPKTAHITDELPMGGFYRYKTNPNMEGNWLISGQMKINRLLSDDEVRSINTAAGTADLPRMSELMSQGRGSSATVYDYETGTVYPLEKTVGEPRTSGLPGGVNPAVKKMRDIPGAETVTDSLDFSPIENALRNAEEAMGASPTKGLTGEQYLARLPKVQSISKAELEASGLESFLRQPENIRRKIPAQELLDVARSRLPKIKTTTLYDSLDNVDYADEQRLINSEDYDMVEDYFETVFFNANATDISPMDFGHHRAVGGSIAHVRGSIINDVRAGTNPNGELRTSVFLEENQSDILGVALAKETLPKRIKEAKDELKVLEQAGDQSKVSDQVRQIALLERQLKAYERAIPVTPQVRETFEKAVQDMEADPEFRTLPDLESQGRDASQRQIKARSKILDASNAIPNREINAQTLGFTLERLEEQMGKTLDSPESPRMKQILLENDLDQALSGTPRIILQNGTGDDLAYRAVFVSRNKTKMSDGPPVQVEPFTIDKINDARVLALQMLEGVPRSTPLEQLSEAAMNNAPNEDVGRLAQGFMAGLRRLTNKFERVVDERPFPSPGEKEEMVSIFDRDIKRRFGAYDTKKYMEERKRLADAVEKINELETDAELAAFDKEAIENKIEDLTKRMADKYKPAEGFMQYLAEVKKIPQLAEYAEEEGISLLPDQPFKNQFESSRSNLMLSIQQAKSDGHRFFYMPDYRDMADLRGMDASKFKVGYKDVPEAVIKELRETFPNLDAGELTDTSWFQDMASDSLRVSKSGKSYRMFRPVTYIDLDTMDTNFKPRRFAKGGQVDLRSGIGNMFRLYS